MTPLSVVQPLSGRYEGSAGVVHSVEKNDDGKVAVVTVELDTDAGKVLVRFAPADLRVLKQH